MRERSISHKILHQLFAWTSCILILVVVVAGIQAGVELRTLIERSAIVLVSLMFVGRVVIRIVSVFEEV